MTTFSGFDANQAIVDFLIDHGTTLPDAARNHLRDVVGGSNPMEAILVAMETLYSVRGREGVSEALPALLKALAVFVATHDFRQRGERANEIEAVADRMIGGGEAVLESDSEVCCTYAPVAFQPVMVPVEPLFMPDPIPNPVP